MAALVLRTLVSAVAGLLGVSASYAVADGRGIGPWLLIFAVGLGVGFGTRGGWLAGLVGVIAAHVFVGYVKTLNGLESGRDAIDFAGDGLLLGITLFTPGYLFGAAARRRPSVAASDGGEAVAADEPWLSRRAMVVIACAILGVFGLLMGYVLVLLLSTGGDRAL
jgi:hypothetical protein